MLTDIRNITVRDTTNHDGYRRCSAIIHSANRGIAFPVLELTTRFVATILMCRYLLYNDPGTATLSTSQCSTRPIPACYLQL